MKVKTWRGLVPLKEFDEVEVHEMGQGEDSLWQIEDCAPGTSVCAYGVFLHRAEGGVESVQDFVFDPSKPGAQEFAKTEAEQLAEQLYGMLDAAGLRRDVPRPLNTISLKLSLDDSRVLIALLDRGDLPWWLVHDGDGIFKVVVDGDETVHVLDLSNGGSWCMRSHLVV